MIERHLRSTREHRDTDFFNMYIRNEDEFSKQANGLLGKYRVVISSTVIYWADVIWWSYKRQPVVKVAYCKNSKNWDTWNNYHNCPTIGTDGFFTVQYCVQKMQTE